MLRRGLFSDPVVVSVLLYLCRYYKNSRSAEDCVGVICFPCYVLYRMRAFVSGKNRLLEIGLWHVSLFFLVLFCYCFSLRPVPCFLPFPILAVDMGRRRGKGGKGGN